MPPMNQWFHSFRFIKQRGRPQSRSHAIKISMAIWLTVELFINQERIDLLHWIWHCSSLGCRLQTHYSSSEHRGSFWFFGSRLNFYLTEKVFIFINYIMIGKHDFVLGYSRFGILEVQNYKSTSVLNQIPFDFEFHFVTDQTKWNK